ncbi:MAG: hypothetical protein CMJ42_03370 [Phyllobacteriaceae bacterium]|nr:hypothetical protein [Phyllobacteriaceae bacterium]MBA92789.1 hypothetical protein [Phyllobacteriaceae bacterium]
MVTVVIVFKSGAVLELPADERKAGILLGDFTNNWDQKGVNLMGDLSANGQAIYRFAATEIAGMSLKAG